MKVLIDPGHGGMVNGEYVTAPSKMYNHGDFIFYEGVFNRELARKIAEELDKEGIDYEYIVKTNNDVSLTTRVRRANSIGKLYDCVYLSIHGNAAGVESANGIEIFTSIGQTGRTGYTDIR
jgi:N-acetylmuramoyl-L-alanine amidase